MMKHVFSLGSSLASVAFVLTHNTIVTGILLFPYTFWAFGGVLETIAAQVEFCTIPMISLAKPDPIV